MSLSSRFPHPPARNTTDKRKQQQKHKDNNNNTGQGTSTSNNAISSSSDTVSTRSEIASPTAVGSRLAELSLPPFPYRNSIILSDAIRSKKRRISPKRTPVLPSIADSDDNVPSQSVTGSPSSRVVPPSKRPRPSFQSSTRSFSKGSYENEAEGTGSTGSSSLISFAWSSVDDAETEVVTVPQRQRHSPVPLEVLEEVKIEVPESSSSVAKALGMPPRDQDHGDSYGDTQRDSLDPEDSREDAIKRFKGLLTTASSAQSRGRLQVFTDELRSSRGDSFPQAELQHRPEQGRHRLRNEPAISDLASRDVSPPTSDQPTSSSRYILLFFLGFLFPPLWLIGSFPRRRKRPPPPEPIETLQIGMALTTDEVVQRRPSPASWVFSWATNPTTNTSSEKSIQSDKKWIWANRIALVFLIVAVIVVIVVVLVVLRPNKKTTIPSPQSASLGAFSLSTSTDMSYTESSIPSYTTSLSLPQSLTQSQSTLLPSYSSFIPQYTSSFLTMSITTTSVPTAT